jgi:flagellar hook-length control protein FliK
MLNIGAINSSLDARLSAKSSALDKSSSAMNLKTSSPENKSVLSPKKKFADELNEKTSAEPSRDVAKASEQTQSRSSRANSEESDRSAERDATVESEASMSSRKIKPATRQAVMEVFLDRMENELGISSGDVLQAFAKLSETELLATPEESAGQFVSELGLGAEDSVKAFDMYSEMLAMAAAGGMSQYLSNSGQKAEVQVLSAEQARLRDLRQSIGTMSDKFFVTGDFAQAPAGLDQQSKISEAMSAQGQVADGQAQGRKPLPFGSFGQGSAASGNLPADVPVTGLESFDPASASAGKFDVSEMTAAKDSSANIDMLNFNSSANTGAEASSLDAFSGFDGETSLGLSGRDAGQALEGGQSFGEMGLSSAAASSQSLATGQEGESNEEFTDGQAEMAPGTRTESTALGQKPVFQVGAPNPTGAEVQTNVKEIISQAQYLASKGGGEMKVTLTPEGMGEVNIKVKMINGQVNVEMVTASDEAKKVLEKGLGELKENLTAHKLNLESIKIDQAKDVSKHFDQQQRDFDQGAQQKFLNDFRERNQGFKREMYELGSASVPASQTRDRALNSSYDPKRASKRSDGSRRLDLVA